tara:strand:+ start:1063 stop:1611 length:549 start_codon:yes stop_codon:yes gene_type:complete
MAEQGCLKDEKYNNLEVDNYLHVNGSINIGDNYRLETFSILTTGLIQGGPNNTIIKQPAKTVVKDLILIPNHDINIGVTKTISISFGSTVNIDKFINNKIIIDGNGNWVENFPGYIITNNIGARDSTIGDTKNKNIQIENVSTYHNDQRNLQITITTTASTPADIANGLGAKFKIIVVFQYL